MDLKETVRQILEQFQAIAHQLPQLVIQIDGKQIGAFLDKGNEYKIDDEKLQFIVKEIKNRYHGPVNSQVILNIIEDLEKDYYFNRMEMVFQKSPFSKPVNAVSYTHLDVYKRQPLGIWMAENLEKGKVAVIEGALGRGDSEAYTEGFKEGLSQNPNLEIVTTISAEWNRQKAYEAATNIITAHPDIVGLFVQNEDMTCLLYTSRCV